MVPGLLRAVLVASFVCAAVTNSEAAAGQVAAVEPEAQEETKPMSDSDMLSWAFDNMDLGDLHRRAEAIRKKQREDGAAPAADDEAGQGLPSPEDPGAKWETGEAAPTTVLTDERKRELNEYLKVLSPDTVKLMTEALEVGTSEANDAETRLMALENLQELVQDIDNAKDFLTIGGGPQVLEILASGPEELQSAAAWIFGTVPQNSEPLQVSLLELGVLPSLNTLLLSSRSTSVRARCVFALGGMLRNFQQGLVAFMAMGGANTLIQTLAATESKLIKKALVLLTDILPEPAVQREILEALGNSSSLCDTIASLLQSDDLDSVEKALEAIEGMAAAGMYPTLRQHCDPERWVEEAEKRSVKGLAEDPESYWAEIQSAIKRVQWKLAGEPTVHDEL